MPTPVAKYDWEQIRNAFVNDSPRPSYIELSERFGAPVGTLTRVSSDQGWPELRVKRMEMALLQSDSMEVLSRAAKADTTVSDLAKDAVLGVLSGILKTVAAIEENKELKERACMDMLNTASFALHNLSNACKGFGITGLPESLRKAAGSTPTGHTGNGQWSPQLLAGLNVTINTMAAAPGKAEISADISGAETVPASQESDDMGARLRKLKPVKP